MGRQMSMREGRHRLYDVVNIDGCDIICLRHEVRAQASEGGPRVSTAAPGGRVLHAQEARQGLIEIRNALLRLHSALDGLARDLEHRPRGVPA